MTRRNRHPRTWPSLAFAPWSDGEGLTAAQRRTAPHLCIGAAGPVHRNRRGIQASQLVQAQAHTHASTGGSAG